ncbi:hypothetical protein [Kallotenue papyrolyticum]|uniref:hypothetical protein n=1 Tax=Kallotenue papyrolyticum TaxID=1325125 RepID=UPI0004726AD7|nr:hypothetical protein [Kallotenue papyrolyticum]
MSTKQVGDLHIGEDLAFQERQWTVERVGWVIMALLALAGLLGLFGGGPLSIAHAGSADQPLRVTYARFARYRTPAELEVSVQPAATQGQALRLSMNRSWLDSMELQGVVPEPEQVEARAEHLIFVFLLEQPGQPLQITFNLQPIRVGAHTLQLGLDGAEPLRVTQLVYP